MSPSPRWHPAVVPRRFGDALRTGRPLRLVTSALPIGAAAAFGMPNRVTVPLASQAFPRAAGGAHALDAPAPGEGYSSHGPAFLVLPGRGGLAPGGLVLTMTTALGHGGARAAGRRAGPRCRGGPPMRASRAARMLGPMRPTTLPRLRMSLLP